MNLHFLIPWASGFAFNRASALGWIFVFVQARFEELDLVERIPPYGEYMKPSRAFCRDSENDPRG